MDSVLDEPAVRKVLHVLSVEVWSNPQGDRYSASQRYSAGQVLTSGVDPGVRVSIDELFARMA